jgi:D-serine deaminase-like pyridoxal phosphate-dependent protein
VHVSEIETPAVVVDLDVMERNLSRMADYCRDKNLNLRPHTKTHKVPELARLQLASGACGITVAKLGEAEVMVRAGITDILIAYPLIGIGKLERLARLASQSNITVALDSEEVARAISHQLNSTRPQVGVLIEIDVGFRRCGVATASEVLNLAQRVRELRGLDFKGVMFFPGHFQVTEQERATLMPEVNRLLRDSLSSLERAQIPIRTVSGGSTPTAREGHLFYGVNEIRPGMYIFNDRNMVGIGIAEVEDCALSVIATVVSTSVSGRAIIDGGSKTFSNDRHHAGNGRGFGIVREDPDAELEALSEEHGHLSIKHSARHYRVGERLTIIPNHVCSTINMHDEIYGVRGERVEAIWNVQGRGKIR